MGAFLDLGRNQRHSTALGEREEEEEEKNGAVGNTLCSCAHIILWQHVMSSERLAEEANKIFFQNEAT